MRMTRAVGYCCGNTDALLPNLVYLRVVPQEHYSPVFLALKHKPGRLYGRRPDGCGWRQDGTEASGAPSGLRTAPDSSARRPDAADGSRRHIRDIAALCRLLSTFVDIRT